MNRDENSRWPKRYRDLTNIEDQTGNFERSRNKIRPDEKILIPALSHSRLSMEAVTIIIYFRNVTDGDIYNVFLELYLIKDNLYRINSIVSHGKLFSIRVILFWISSVIQTMMF